MTTVDGKWAGRLPDLLDDLTSACGVMTSLLLVEWAYDLIYLFVSIMTCTPIWTQTYEPIYYSDAGLQSFFKGPEFQSL